MFIYLQDNNTIVRIFNFKEGLLISSPTCHFFGRSARSHCDSVFRSCMVEESGTLESQLEATKVSDAHSPAAETPFPMGDLGTRGGNGNACN